MAFPPKPTLLMSYSDWSLKPLFVGLLLLPSFTSAQLLNHIPDSLARYLKTAPPDSNQVRAAYQYVWWLLNPLDNPERADSLLQRTQRTAIKLTEIYHLTDYVTRSYVGVSQVMIVMGHQPEARHYAHKALALAYQDQDKTMIFWAENTIVSLLKNPHPKHEELGHLFRALPYAERYANNTWKASLWGTISDIYMELHQYANARQFLKKSERLIDSDKTGAIKLSVYDGLGITNST